MVASPRDYPWSSYHAHAFGDADTLVSDHPLYRMLGRGALERQTAYRELFSSQLSDEFIDAVRAATNGGWALGNDRFKHQIAKAVGRRAGRLVKGRPPSARKDARQLNLL